MSQTLLWKDLALDRIGFAPAKRTPSGGTRVDVDYQLPQSDGKIGLRQIVRVQMPRFKRVMISESKYKPGKWTAAFACNGYDVKGTEVHGFVNNWLLPLEKRVRETSCSESMAWFKKDLDIKTAEAMYTSCVKPASDSAKEKHGSELAPLLKCNIESSTRRIDLDVYRGNERAPSSLAEMRDHEGRKEVVGIVDVQSVWFMGMQFGVTPVLRSLLWFPEDRPQGASAFIDDCSGDGGGEPDHPPDDDDRDLAMRFLGDQPPAKRQRGSE